MAAFDLESQFFHVYMNKEQQTYFGFCINDKNNMEVYYRGRRIYQYKLRRINMY